MSPSRRRLVGGLDLGGTKIQAVILDGRRQVVAEAKRPTPARGGGKGVIKALGATLAEVCTDAGVETRHLVGVGVGSPGAIDARRGVVSGARNLPGGGAPIRMASGLKRLTGTPAYIDNDVTVGVHAEYVLGAAQSSNSLLGVWWGTGVGGGVVLDGKKWEGRGAAGELATWWSRWAARSAPAGDSAVSRRTPVAEPWSYAPATCTSAATRPTCSRSWRSAAVPGCSPGSGRARSTTRIRWRSS